MPVSSSVITANGVTSEPVPDRSRNGYKISLFAHFRECVNTLSYIHKAHCHIHKISLRMFIHNPHYFAGIHCGTAADSDNAVRLKQTSWLLHPPLRRQVSGQALHRKILCMHNTQFIKFVCDRILYSRFCRGTDRLR